MRVGLVLRLMVGIFSLFLVGITYAEDKSIDPTKPARISGSLEKNKAQADNGDELSQTQWLLSAIFYSGVRQVAVINGRSLTVGEEVNGQTVDEIMEDKVVLLKKGEKMELKLALHPVKTELVE